MEHITKEDYNHTSNFLYNITGLFPVFVHPLPYGGTR